MTYTKVTKIYKIKHAVIQIKALETMAVVAQTYGRQALITVEKQNKIQATKT